MSEQTTAAGVDEILIVAFGGPTPGCCKTFDECPGEAYCFVSGIFGHNEARKARIEEVTQHYTDLGGFSNFNKHTEDQAAALHEALKARGLNLPIRCGYQHWMPYVRDVIAEMKSDSVGKVLVLIMAPHQSSVSWDLYLRIVGEGISLAGEGAPQVSGVVDSWSNKPGFINAIAGRIREACERDGVDINDPATHLVMSAHAVPKPVARTSNYCELIEETAALVAKELGQSEYTLAYQSQPSDSKIEWTGPGLEHAIEELGKRGDVKAVVGSAIGFLCDNVEVLHDLGVEGKEEAEKAGMTFVRAESVHTHPEFIALLADQVEAKLAELAKSSE